MAAPAIVTPAEYLAAERRSPTRHELVNGVVYAMAGASRGHSRIVSNLILALGGRLRGSGCAPYANDLRVNIPTTQMYTYPDVAIVCDDAAMVDDEFDDTVLEPTVIIEVFSPSTNSYDRNEKFAHYRLIETLTTYVIIEQTHLHVECYIKSEGWAMAEYDGLDAELPLSDFGITVPLSEIYEDVKFKRPRSRMPQIWTRPG